MTMRIAVAQIDAALTTLEDRKAALVAAVEDAANRGSELTLLPELALTGYGAGADIQAKADGPDGAEVHWLKELAARTNCALVAGLALKQGKEVFNSALFAAPDGQCVFYNKIHLYGDYEKALFSRGRARPPIIQYRDLKLGLLVCFDVEFPERVRDLATRGADAVLVPTALPESDGGAFIAQNVVPVRAFENQLFLAYANHCGVDERFTYQGQSCIAAPDGSLLAQASSKQSGLILADIDTEAFADCREQNPYLAEVQLTQYLEDSTVAKL
ncbi:putative amidohydrolase [Labrenzia sp. MBR-25]|jgi:predicted amidohydrolase